MKLFLFKGLISTVILIGFVFLYGRFCDYFFTQKKYLDVSEKKQWVLAQEGGDWDYAVLGSSRAFGAFDMSLLDSLTGMKGINIASDGSGFKDNYLILSHFLKSNKIERLYLQIDEGSLNSKESFSNEFHAFRFLPYWKDDTVKSVLRNEIPFFNNFLTENFPEWRYFYFNKYFSPKEVMKRLLNSTKQKDGYLNTSGGKGKIFSQIANKGQIITKTKGEKQINPEDWEYLLRITNLMEDRGVQIVNFVAPTYLDDLSFLKSELKGFSYPLYFPDKFNIDDPKLFVDKGHLNSIGRLEFTVLFSEYLDRSI